MFESIAELMYKVKVLFSPVNLMVNNFVRL